MDKQQAEVMVRIVSQGLIAPNTNDGFFDVMSELLMNVHKSAYANGRHDALSVPEAAQGTHTLGETVTEPQTPVQRASGPVVSASDHKHYRPRYNPHLAKMLKDSNAEAIQYVNDYHNR